MVALRVFLVLALLGGQMIAAIFSISLEELKEFAVFLLDFIKKLGDTSWLVLAVGYAVVFLVTLIPAVLVLKAYKRALETVIAENTLRAWLVLFGWTLVFLPVWFAPSLSLFFTGRAVGISLTKLMVPFLLIVLVSLFTLVPKLRSQN